MVRVVELGGQPDVGPGHARGPDAGADLGLVAVGGGRVDVAVAGAEGGLDGGLDLVRAGAPGAEADDGHLVARVEGVSAPTEHAWLAARCCQKYKNVYVVCLRGAMLSFVSAQLNSYPDSWTDK